MPETPGASTAAAPVQPGLPPLYRALEGLTAERHGRLRLRDVGFGFAAGAAAIPLAAEEFGIAARSLAIVFAAEPPHLPVALTGLAPGSNLYVDSGGAWRNGAYVPAYLRRLPFLLLRAAPGSDELVLCIDPQAPQLGEAEGEPLFTPEGKPTLALDRALGFTRSVEEAMLRTQAMTARLAALGLLKPSVVQFEHHGKPLRIDGFHAVDRPALAALAAEHLVELRDKGWLEPIFAHLLSIGGLPELARDLAS